MLTWSVLVRVITCVSPHLMVPVGEGSGEPNALMCSSCCCIVGMLIFRGEMWGRSGRGGREGCSLSLCSSGSSSDINWILITVLGKRNTHLESRKARRGDGERAEGHMKNIHQNIFHIIILSRWSLSCCHRRLNLTSQTLKHLVLKLWCRFFFSPTFWWGEYFF